MSADEAKIGTYRVKIQNMPGRATRVVLNDEKSASPRVVVDMHGSGSVFYWGDRREPLTVDAFRRRLKSLLGENASWIFERLRVDPGARMLPAPARGAKLTPKRVPRAAIRTPVVPPPQRQPVTAPPDKVPEEPPRGAEMVEDIVDLVDDPSEYLNQPGTEPVAGLPRPVDPAAPEDAVPSVVEEDDEDGEFDGGEQPEQPPRELERGEGEIVIVAVPGEGEFVLVRRYKNTYRLRPIGGSPKDGFSRPRDKCIEVRVVPEEETLAGPDPGEDV